MNFFTKLKEVIITHIKSIPSKLNPLHPNFGVFTPEFIIFWIFLGYISVKVNAIRERNMEEVEQSQ